MQLNGARILIECLIREGVNIIFGYPGGSVLDIYDELPQYGEQLRHILVRHEQAAVHAADGYARATGKVGVCMATSGPVLVDLPKNVLQGSAEFVWPEDVSLRSYNPTYRPNYAQIRKVVDALYNAERPLLFGGGGVIMSNASEEFRNLAKNLSIPVTCSLMGLGAFPCDHPQWLGMLGMHGTYAANKAVSNADLLIAVGVRFDDRVTGRLSSFAPKATIVHIDIDRAEINKNVQTDHHIIGDAKQVLNLLLERLPQYEHKEWKDFVLSFPRETEYGESESVLTPKQVLSAIARKCPQDSIVATDVGQHQMWAIQHLHFDYPGQLLTSGGFGTMGFGLGAAIGAKQGNPDKTVIHITGDGCFRMNGNELATEAYYGLPVITVIFNNRNLGMVRQWQSLIYDHRYSQTSLENRSPDFVKFADAFGLKGRRVTQPSELEEAITEALAESAQGRGYVIDCAINADEMVHPMVNGGHHITEFLLS